MMKLFIILCPSLFICMFFRHNFRKTRCACLISTRQALPVSRQLEAPWGPWAGILLLLMLIRQGLAFYKTSEFLLSPGWTFDSPKPDIFQQTREVRRKSFYPGHDQELFLAGVQTGQNSQPSVIAVNQSADFNGHIIPIRGKITILQPLKRMAKSSTIPA